MLPYKAGKRGHHCGVYWLQSRSGNILDCLISINLKTEMKWKISKTTQLTKSNGKEIENLNSPISTKELNSD